MDVTAGESATLLFDFFVDGDFVSPGAATYTVRDHAGATIAGLVDQAIDLTGSPTHVEISVDASKNTVANGFLYENRTVEVKFTSNGDVYRVRQSYRVTPWLNYTATPADVRTAIGCMTHELPDADIDLVSAYFEVADNVGSDVLTTALAAGDITNHYANDAIKFWAAILSLPSLQVRISQNQQDDTHTLERTKLDFDQLRADLQAGYELAAENMVPVANRPAVRNVSPLIVTTPTDVITGA